MSIAPVNAIDAEIKEYQIIQESSFRGLNDILLHIFEYLPNPIESKNPLMQICKFLHKRVRRAYYPKVNFGMFKNYVQGRAKGNNVLKTLFDANFTNVDQKHTNVNYAFFCAIVRGDAHLIESLLSDPQLAIMPSWHKNLALNYTSFTGNKSILKLIFNHPQFTRDASSGAIKYASYGHNSGLYQLISENCQPESYGIYKQNVRSLAFKRKDANHVELCKDAFNNGLVSEDDYLHAIEWAIVEGDPEAVEFLLNQTNYDIVSKISLEQFHYVLDKIKNNFNVQRYKEILLLIDNSLNDQLESLKKSLKEGMPLPEFLSIFHMAVMKGDPEYIKLLLDLNDLLYLLVTTRPTNVDSSIGIADFLIANGHKTQESQKIIAMIQTARSSFKSPPIEGRKILKVNRGRKKNS